MNVSSAGSSAISLLGLSFGARGGGTDAAATDALAAAAGTSPGTADAIVDISSTAAMLSALTGSGVAPSSLLAVGGFQSAASSFELLSGSPYGSSGGSSAEVPLLAGSFGNAVAGGRLSTATSAAGNASAAAAAGASAAYADSLIRLQASGDALSSLLGSGDLPLSGALYSVLG